MEGILAVWKPEGWTSHDVVAKVRRIIRMKRIGHTGTLDPMVTGVLPLCLGRSTRVVEYIQDRPKAYKAVIKLGIATDTEDLTGEVIEQQVVGTLTIQQIEQTLKQFIGNNEQTPPMFSAVKVDGKRLYELAREGKSVERKSRTVTIHEIDLIEANMALEQPEVTFSTICSKGTYIRTLCVDIGKALGVPATMAKLTRTMSGGLEEKHCLTLEQIEDLQGKGELATHLIQSDEAISHINKAQISDAHAKLVLQGQKLALSHVEMISEQDEQKTLVRLYDRTERFLGIFETDQEAGLLRPVKVFSD